MTVVYTDPAVPCRRAIVPPCDPVSAASGTNPPSVDGKVMLIRKGDIIDVGLDWSQWLASNGGKLKTSSWAAHGSSPATPTFSGATTLIDKEHNHTLAILNTSGNAENDVLWIVNTVVIEGIPDASGFTMPDRTLLRKIDVKVVK